MTDYVDYETEGEYETQTPVHVKVLNFPEPDEPAVPHSIATSTYTDLSTVLQVLELDPLRAKATVLINGTGTVTLCHSQNQAQAVLSGGASSQTQGATIVGPGTGSSVTLTFEHVAPMWAVLQGASPSLSLIVERRAS